MSTITQRDAASSNNTDFKINQNVNKKEASKNITLALVVNSWRLKREEVKSLRETLAQRTSSEGRLALQVDSLKKLLRADCQKVGAAMAEVKRLREELNGRAEDKVFENEKSALQRSASLAEQRASGIQELWRSCKADLAAARLQAAQAHALVTAERVKHRQARDHNAELLDKITQNETQNNFLQNQLQQANSEISELKAFIKTKAEYIESIETELVLVKKYLNQKDMHIESKDNELLIESLKSKELHLKVIDLKSQLQVAREKLQRWPFYLASSWPLQYSIGLPINVGSWWSNLTQRLFSVATIFATR